MALAAPVGVGDDVDGAGAAAALVALCAAGPSSGIWSPVQAWMVVMMPATIGAKSFRASWPSGRGSWWCRRRRR